MFLLPVVFFLLRLLPFFPIPFLLKDTAQRDGSGQNRFILNAFIKDMCAEDFRKICPSTILCESPLKIPGHLVQLLAIRNKLPTRE
jgi:hypothetical protein